MTRFWERAMTVFAVVGTIAAVGLASEVRGPVGGDDWTDGSAGAWLFVLAGLVPVVVAGVACASGRRGRTRALLPLAIAAFLAASTVVGELLHVPDQPIDPTFLAAVGAGLDVACVVLAAATVATLLSPRLAQGVGAIATTGGIVAAVAFGFAVSPTAIPRPLPSVSPLQVPSLAFLGDSGEAMLLVLAFVPILAITFLVWVLAGTTLQNRRRVRWLALSCVAGIGVLAVTQLVWRLGLFEVDDGFFAAFPRALAWAAVSAGLAATIAQPNVGDAAVAVRKVAVGISLVMVLGAAAGVAWFAADATTGAIVPGAPLAAAILAIAALFLPVRDRLEWAADRWLFGEIGSDARLIDAFGASAEHAGSAEVLELLVTTARRVVGLRWARASALGFTPVVPAVGVPVDVSPSPVASFPLAESGEQLGLLECGAKRRGQFTGHDRQLLGALGREAALRLRTVSQAEELAARLRQIEHQAQEIAASRARIVEAQDEERRRLERDIHDGVQQDLASLIGKLRLALNQLAASPADATGTIASAQDDVRRALNDVRAIAQGIHPAILDDQGLVRAIDARAKRLPFEVIVDVPGELVTRRFDRSIEGAAYFVVSEAFANIVKHAEASAVAVDMSLDADRLTITVADDGRGLGDSIVRGSGLTNMNDRAAALGGSVHVEPNPDGGTKVIVELPLAPTVAV